MSAAGFRSLDERWAAAMDAFNADAPLSAFYASLGHQDALSRLPVLTTPGAFVVITGDAGMGKSMLVWVAANDLPATIVPVIAGPVGETSTDVRFLRSLVVAAGQSPRSRTGLGLTGELTSWAASLAPTGRSATIIVDDAHLRPATQLEIIRTLVTAASPAIPLSVLMLGESDLLERLNRKRNLASRVSLHYALNPLSESDGAALIAHRLRAFDCVPDELITSDARTELARLAGGNPGEIVRLAGMAIERRTAVAGPLTTNELFALSGDPAAKPSVQTLSEMNSVPGSQLFLKGGDAMNGNRNPAGSRHANVARSGHEKTGAPTPDSSADSNRLSG